MEESDAPGASRVERFLLDRRSIARRVLNPPGGLSL
jgi:hypothetical protein